MISGAKRATRKGLAVERRGDPDGISTRMGLAVFPTPSTVFCRFNMSLKDLPAEVGVFPPMFFGQDLLDWRRGGLST
jgi:hypothetical protein